MESLCAWIIYGFEPNVGGLVLHEILKTMHLLQMHTK